MSVFTIAEARLIALFAQCILYGIHFMTFGDCMQTLYQTSFKRSKPVNRTLLLITIGLFTVGTLDVCFDLYHNLSAFIFYTGPGGPDELFNHISWWLNVMRSVWVFLAVLLADFALILRCWMVNDRNWCIIILPIALWCGTASSAILELYYTATTHALTNLSHALKANRFATVSAAVSTSLNVLTTGLIVYRIERIRRRSTKYFSGTNGGIASGRKIELADITRILVESAAFYTLTGVIVLICNVTGSNSLCIVSDSLLELAGIQFDLIIIRVGRGVSSENIITVAQMTRHLELHNRTPASDSRLIRTALEDTMEEEHVVEGNSLKLNSLVYDGAVDA